MSIKDYRIIFMGTPQFSVPCLEILREMGCTIAAVITKIDKAQGRGGKVIFSPVKTLALESGYSVLQPFELRSPEFHKTICELKPDLFVTAAYGKIIPGHILSIPPLGCINVHASLLPAHRGPAPIFHAIINGDEKTGITTMFSDEGIDTGDMILKSEIKLDGTETGGQLYETLSVLGAKTLRDTLSLLSEGMITRQKQDDSQASYAPVITRETARIDWNRTGLEISRLTRALDPKPGAYTYYNGTQLKIFASVPEEGLTEESPGTITGISGDSITVACAASKLKLLTIQLPGKRIMTVKEYLNGNSVIRGARFE